MARVVGIPREIKEDEGRVAIAPAGVHALVSGGGGSPKVRVLVEAGSGFTSGIEDAEFASAGAEIVEDAARIWAESDIVVKVKEPLPSEYPLVREGQVVFTFFHFASSRELTEAMIESGASCVAYETIRDRNGRLPILTPMSEIAGRMSVFEGSKHLESPFGGRGVLVSGVPGVEPAKVVILGGGVVGINAAKIAAGVGAQVSIFDVSHDRLRYLDDVLPPNVTTLYSNPFVVRKKVWQADLVVGAVLVAGAKAPLLVTRDDVRRMKDRSVVGGGARAPRRGYGEGSFRRGRRRRRPGRLYRDVPAHDAQRSDVRRGRRSPLLRCQHAWCRGKNVHIRAHKRYSAVPRGAGS